jgi:hypothetical protein
LVVKDRKKPSAQIGPGLPKMLFGDRADQGVLYEVVGSRRVPGQCARIAPQLWNFGLNNSVKSLTDLPFAVPASAGARPLDQANIDFPCKSTMRTYDLSVTYCYFL